MHLIQSFENIGGEFFTSRVQFRSKLERIRVYLFDWDGVFNDGVKFGEQGSPFSEPDSMGINMLRFSHWLIHGEMPGVFIITGSNNAASHQFAHREHVDGVYFNHKDKVSVLQDIHERLQIPNEEMAFAYDDILDLGAAALCGVRLVVRRDASPLFREYLVDHMRPDYITGNPGGRHAVREVCELLIGLRGNYRETIEHRMGLTKEYQDYLKQRDAITTEMWDGKKG